MRQCTANVRYWGQSGHAVLRCTCPLMTQSGLGAIWSISKATGLTGLRELCPFSHNDKKRNAGTQRDTSPFTRIPRSTAPKAIFDLPQIRLPLLVKESCVPQRRDRTASVTLDARRRPSVDGLVFNFWHCRLIGGGCGARMQNVECSGRLTAA